MAYVDGSSKTFAASVDLTNFQYTFCKNDPANFGQIIPATSPTDAILGVIMDNPLAGDVSEVRLRNAGGTCHAYAGATITGNERLTINSTGQLIPATTTGQEVVGFALYPAVVGQLVEFVNTTGKF